MTEKMQKISKKDLQRIYKVAGEEFRSRIAFTRDYLDNNGPFETKEDRSRAVQRASEVWMEKEEREFIEKFEEVAAKIEEDKKKSKAQVWEEWKKFIEDQKFTLDHPSFVYISQEDLQSIIMQLIEAVYPRKEDQDGI